MKFNRFYLAVAAIILLSSIFTGAQEVEQSSTPPVDAATETEQVSSPEDYNKIELTTRVSEFGRTDDLDRRKQLDNFLIELKNNPGTTGYILFYQGKDATPSQYGVKGEELYLPHIRFKNYDEGNIVFLNGFRERQTTEFWIVPAYGKLPELTATIASLEAPKNDTFLFHRSHFDFTADDFVLPRVIEQRELSREEYLRDNGDFVSAEEETLPAVIEKSAGEINAEVFSRAGYEFAEKFKTDSQDRGVIVFYADDKMFDVKKLVDDMRNRVAGVAAQAGVAPNRFEVVFGGYRRGIEIEMWVVPNAAKAPLAKPAQPQATAD